MPARRFPSILRLRISIIGIEPEIWRTIDVDDSLTLAQLHQVLQIAFNWFGSHLHRFSEDDPWARSNGIPRIGRRPEPGWMRGRSLSPRSRVRRTRRSRRSVRVVERFLPGEGGKRRLPGENTGDGEERDKRQEGTGGSEHQYGLWEAHG